MTDDLEEFNPDRSLKNEVLVVSSFVFLIGLFGFFDLYEDWVEGVSTSHLVFESLINVIELFAGAYLFMRITRSKHKTIRQMRSEFVEAKKSATEYKSQVDNFRNGITDAISKQFQVWQLTPAEEEICLLLLKGFSLQEIAELRETSERTIRQQAYNMYKKTGLSGRAQLSAFFLEDMLVMKN